jgi:putative SOS response-associated peptidase YedK
VCGRYTLAAGSDELAEAFDVAPLTFAWSPRYNIAPGQQAPVLAADRRGRRIGLLTWGLVPARAERPDTGHINARAESVMERPSFREAFERRRCLVPADGFYEWKREGAKKTPYWLSPRDGALLAFAGIWERWSRPGAEPRHTFAILTTQASDDVADIHDRMPVIIGLSDRVEWLDPEADRSALVAFLRPAPAGLLAKRRVSARVNRVAEDDAGLVEEASRP